MIRICIVCILLVVTNGLLFGQKVQSSCITSDSIVKLLQEDAFRLTVRKIAQSNYELKNRVDIPKIYTDTVLNALIAVRNASTLKAVDTIRTVRTYPSPDVQTINIMADSNLTWMHNLRNNTIPTGAHQIDSLIELYKLNLDYYWAFKSFPYHFVSFKSDSFLNIEPLTKIVETIPGVYHSELNLVAGDGDNITDSIFSDYVELIYSIGWGDCPMGCSFRRYWKFLVYWDCSVEFVESYGHLLPLTSLAEIELNKIQVYPIPFDETIKISGIEKEFDYSITTLTGQEIKRGRSIIEIPELDVLKPGLYLLKLSMGQQHKIVKIIKTKQ